MRLIADHPKIAMAICFGLYCAASNADYHEQKAREQHRIASYCKPALQSQPLIAAHFSRADGGQSTLVCTYGQRPAGQTVAEKR